MKLSTASVMVWKVAALETVWGAHASIATTHLWLGLLSLKKVLCGEFGSETTLDEEQRRSVDAEFLELCELLRPFRVRFREWRHAIREELGPGDCARDGGTIHRTPEARCVFERAADLAGPDEIRIRHLLMAVAESPGAATERALERLGVDRKELLRHLRGAATNEVASPPRPDEPATDGALPAPRSGARQPDWDGHQPPPAREGGGATVAEPGPSPVTVKKPLQPWELPPELRPQQAVLETAPAPGKKSLLKKFGRNLTELARRGKLGPFVGRHRELSELVQCLLRRHKNNPVLIGEAGVGKTAVVEALAEAAVREPDHPLKGRTIIEVPMAGLVAGTKYRGELEERIQAFLKEATSRRDLILFIDEVHTLVGAGRAEGGTLDAGNMLKPALARGEIRLIGATTVAEYQRFIEKDPALERRFDKILVPEPELHEAVEIVSAFKKGLEQHHGVAFEPEVFRRAVELTHRFQVDRRLPDKAIDLLDQCGARARSASLERVDARLLAQVLSERLGVPMEIVAGSATGSERPKVLDLESFLRERLVGQDQAVEKVCQRLLLAHSGLKPERGPLATFLFLGPPGVGKTEMARLLAEFLFGDSRRMLRLDMSEYAQPHSVSRLIGAPPGYAGCDRGGQLTDPLRSRPYCVVLLDEVEKAHPAIYDLFLQVFDEGRLTDGQGRTADASQAVFVMTSNLIRGGGERQLGLRKRDESRGRERDLREELQAYFRPEFLDRLQELVLFRPLQPESVRRILERRLDEVARKVRTEHGVELRWTAQALEHLAGGCYRAEDGARPLQRTVEREVLLPLGRLALEGRLAQHSAWRITVADGSLSFAPETAP
ncbi:MAG: ATP-dependent Clp protease ATP-binding subunit [Armatimonadetes bacterium]|nr:ATP-dependent Clp protease ATP-binding subunit [Armatimonadota bacterium]